MAVMRNIVQFEIDPSQPVAELNNVISGVIRMYPGSEMDILRGVRKSIDEALAFYERKDEQGKAKQQEAQKERADPA